MEVNTQYAGVSYAGYYAAKTTSTTTFESTIDAQGTADEKRMSAKNYTETVTSKELFYQQYYMGRYEAAHNALTKTQELALLGDTTVGISSNESVKECASLEKNDEDKVWTITAFTEDGIICTQGKKGETFKELWKIDYQHTDDAKRVWDFLDQFDSDADLKFAGLKSFWEDFLSSDQNGDEILKELDLLMSES
ncbi:MAG: hypothetical protein ACI4GD_12275 [Lachnospiraceae bacterium]